MPRRIARTARALKTLLIQAKIRKLEREEDSLEPSHDEALLSSSLGENLTFRRQDSFSAAEEGAEDVKKREKRMRVDTAKERVRNFKHTPSPLGIYSWSPNEDSSRNNYKETYCEEYSLAAATSSSDDMDTDITPELPKPKESDLQPESTLAKLPKETKDRVRALRKRVKGGFKGERQTEI